MIYHFSDCIVCEQSLFGPAHIYYDQAYWLLKVYLLSHPTPTRPSSLQICYMMEIWIFLRSSFLGLKLTDFEVQPDRILCFTDGNSVSIVISCQINNCLICWFFYHLSQYINISKYDLNIHIAKKHLDRYGSVWWLYNYNLDSNNLIHILKKWNKTPQYRNIHFV